MSGKNTATGRLHGEIAVVSGAAGGIGAAICRRFTEEGARVAALDVNSTGFGAAFIRCDLGIDEDVRAAGRIVEERLGRPSIVVHAAAVSEHAATLDSSAETFARVYNVNLIGALRLVQCFAGAMRTRKDGSIIFISSINGEMGAPGLSAYASSKGALNTLARTLALELAADGVRVNAIAPASVDTPLLQASFDGHPDPAAARAANVRRHPLGRLGTPGDVADLALFLASRESSWITGNVCLIDGGAHLARR